MQHNFAHVLSNLAADPDLRQLMGSAGRALVENEYGWAAIVERWLRELGARDF
jgi:glycosyltransferase involved in cell wall biosynthesis